MTWETFIKEEQNKEYYINLMQFINKEYREKVIYPKYDLILNALKLTPLNNVKVVIIGQDPYHTPGFANGLAFSVNECSRPSAFPSFTATAMRWPSCGRS